MAREFTEGELAIIERTVYTTLEKVEARLCEKFKSIVADHANACPVKEEVQALVNQGRGVGKTVAVIVAIIASAAAVSATIASVCGK